MNFSLMNYLTKRRQEECQHTAISVSLSVAAHFPRVLLNVMEIENDAKIRPLPHLPSHPLPLFPRHFFFNKEPTKSEDGEIA